MGTLPVVADLSASLCRLAREEDDERRELAQLMARLRRFEDVDRPAYEAWLHLELGPVLGERDELQAALRARELLAARVEELVEEHGMHPREALYVVREGMPAGGARSAGDETRAEVEARRRAKRDRKRAARKQARGAATAGVSVRASDGPARQRLVGLYRSLARRLHPDSTAVLRALAPARLRAVWAEVQAAYGARNLDRLLALATWLEATAQHGVDGPHAPLLSLGERHERLRALRRSRRALDRRLAELADEPAAGFPEASASARRRLKRAAGRRLADEIAEVRVALEEVEGFLATIGPPRPPRVPRRR